MSGIGGHVNRADRARRTAPAPDLDPRLEAILALAEALGTPLDPWQRVLVEAHLDPRTIALHFPRRAGRTAVHRVLSSWHANRCAIDLNPAQRDD